MNANLVTTATVAHALRLRQADHGYGISFHLGCRCGHSFGAPFEIRAATVDRLSLYRHLADLLAANAAEVVAHRAEFGLSDPGPEGGMDHLVYKAGSKEPVVDFQI